MEQNGNYTSAERAAIAACPVCSRRGLLDFAPVPVRYRHDGWTPERQRLYVAALHDTGHGGKAARAVGMTERSAARLRRRPDAAGFARACAAAYSSARRRRTLARLAAARRRPAEGPDFLSFREAGP